jgi:hypothetical protein
VRKFAIAGAVLLLLTAGVAYASIPGPDGVIHGCYKNNNPAQGALLAIDSAASCPSGYTALNWNQTGPQGPTGPPGLSGVHIVTVVVTSSVRVECPSGETALGIAFSQSPQVFSKTYSTMPIFDGTRPIGYDVDGSAAVSSAHLTCATAS